MFSILKPTKKTICGCPMTIRFPSLYFALKIEQGNVEDKGVSNTYRFPRHYTYLHLINSKYEIRITVSAYCL
jgi:hypothetical protein